MVEMVKVFVDEYNVIGDDDPIPRGLGDIPNLIDADLLKDYDWKAGSWYPTDIPKQVYISKEEYDKFRESIITVKNILDSVYQKLEEYYGDD